LQRYLLIAIGGALGSVARYWVSSTIAARMGISFPYGTMAVNLSACLIIGFAISSMGRQAARTSYWRYLVGIGFIGAYSTFATFEWETLGTLRSEGFLLAALYSLGSFILGLIAVWGGSALAEAL
jgi:fluoride exporter